MTSFVGTPKHSNRELTFTLEPRLFDLEDNEPSFDRLVNQENDTQKSPLLLFNSKNTQESVLYNTTMESSKTPIGGNVPKPTKEAVLTNFDAQESTEVGGKHDDPLPEPRSYLEKR